MFHKNGSIFDNVYPKSDWCDGLDYSLKNELKNGFMDESKAKTQIGFSKLDMSVVSSEKSINLASHSVCDQKNQSINWGLKSSATLIVNGSVGQKGDKIKSLEIETKTKVADESEKVFDNLNKKSDDTSPKKESDGLNQTSETRIATRSITSEVTNGFETTCQNLNNQSHDQGTGTEVLSNYGLEKPDIGANESIEVQGSAQNRVHDAFNFQEEDAASAIVPFSSIFSRKTSKLKSGISIEHDSNPNSKLSPTLNTSCNDESVCDSSDQITSTTKDSSQIIKRKAGRPRKLFKMNQQTPGSESSLKRKRGRPKKNLSAPLSDSISPDSTLEKTVPTPETRTPQLSTIDPSVGPTTATSDPQQLSVDLLSFQKVPACQTEQTSHLTSEAEPVKRKRGRPKKNPSQSQSFVQSPVLETSFSSETDDFRETIVTKSDAETAVSSLKMQKKNLLEVHYPSSTEAKQLSTPNPIVQKVFCEIESIASSVVPEFEKKEKTIPELLLTDLRFHWEDDDFLSTEIVFENQPVKLSDQEADASADSENYCEPCSFQARSTIELRKHLMEVHTLEEEKDENLDSFWMLLDGVGRKGYIRCSVCEMKTENFSCLREHFKGAHKKVTKNNFHKFQKRKLTQTQVAAIKVCSICGFNAKSSFVLQ